MDQKCPLEGPWKFLLICAAEMSLYYLFKTKPVSKLKVLKRARSGDQGGRNLDRVRSHARQGHEPSFSCPYVRGSKCFLVAYLSLVHRHRRSGWAEDREGRRGREGRGEEGLVSVPTTSSAGVDEDN